VWAKDLRDSDPTPPADGHEHLFRIHLAELSSGGPEGPEPDDPRPPLHRWLDPMLGHPAISDPPGAAHEETQQT
jgi:hypothetical protein